MIYTKNETVINNLENALKNDCFKLKIIEEKIKTKYDWDLVSLIIILLLTGILASNNPRITLDLILERIYNLIPISIGIYLLERTVTALIYGPNFLNKKKRKNIKSKIRETNYLVKNFKKAQELEKNQKYIFEGQEKEIEVKEDILEEPTFDRTSKIKTIGSLKR